MCIRDSNSGGADTDAGLLIQRGSAGNNAAFYWNEGADKFKAVLTTSAATASAVTDSSTATIVANLEGCQKCRGTYYYNYGNTWEYLDNIFISKKRDISFIQDTINTHITNINSYQDTGRPKSFNPKNKEGVSDHFAMIAKFQIN